MKANSVPRKSIPLRAFWLLPIMGLAAYFYMTSPDEGSYAPCLIRAWTGLECVGCGGQRAAHALLHGRLSEAASLNLFLMLALPVCLLAGMAHQVWPAQMGRAWRRGGGWIILAVFLLAVLFVLYRNYPG